MNGETFPKRNAGLIIVNDLLNNNRTSIIVSADMDHTLWTSKRGSTEPRNLAR